MTTQENTIVMIPARMASSRLPGKPLAEIAGEALIVHVWRRAVAAEVGPVIVACAEEEIAAAIRAAGGEAVLTRAEHRSGSDRIFEALAAYDSGRRFERIINLQGDVPDLDPAAIRAVADLLDDPAVDIGTLAAEISDEAEIANPDTPMVVVGFAPAQRRARALYFSRAAAPWGDGPYYHHVGIYAYRRAALERFTTLPPGILEQREKLEQLRALEAGMRIDVALIDTVPLGVDTPADLERARQMLAAPEL